MSERTNPDDLHLCHVCYRWWHESDFAELRSEHKVCHYCTIVRRERATTTAQAPVLLKAS